MSSCQGEVSCGTKVDREMAEYIESEAGRVGVSKAEFQRRLLELYRQSRREALGCPECGTSVVFDVRGQ